MTREYTLVTDPNGESVPYIVREYTSPGLSWRDAKKELRQWYLNQAGKVRELRPADAEPVGRVDDDLAHDEGTMEGLEDIARGANS